MKKENRKHIFLFLIIVLISSFLLCLNWQRQVTIYLLSIYDTPIELKLHTRQNEIVYSGKLEEELWIESIFSHNSSESGYLKIEMKSGNDHSEYEVMLWPLFYRHIIFMFSEDEEGKVKVKTDRRLRKPIFQ